MKLSKIFSIVILVFSTSVCVAEDLTPEKKKLIDVILEQTGQSTLAMSKQFSELFVQQMSMMLQSSQPDMDPKVFDLVQEVVDEAIHEEMIVNGFFKDLMYPVYSKHFSVEELEKMVELNNSELGKKMIRVMPLISQEGMQAGQLFGQKIAPVIQQRLIERFEKEGIK
ncbi:MAG: DUF2059 domain-containing protein [Gammaproteobacteria bacterium]